MFLKSQTRTDFKESTSNQRKANFSPSKRFVYECLLGFKISLTKSIGLLFKCLGENGFMSVKGRNLKL